MNILFADLKLKFVGQFVLLRTTRKFLSLVFTLPRRLWSFRERDRCDLQVNAEKVKNELLQKVAGLSKNAEIYPPDKYKKDNNKNYRPFEIHRYRVSYLVQTDVIIISRLRHTSREPQIF